MTFDHPRHVDPRNGERRYQYEPGAPTVVLLHGLTATPRQFDEFAPLLVKRGRNVLVPRLPKHGYHNRMTNALADLELAELIAAVKHALQEAHAWGSPVTVAGFSLGGLLSAYAAQREEVERAVCIAPFLGIRWFPRAVNRSGSSVLKLFPDVFLWWNPMKRDGNGKRDGYPRYPISAVRKAYELASAVFEDARTRPPSASSIAIVTNEGESTCHNGLARELAQTWRDAGATVEEHVLDLPPSHDFMTPRRGREQLRERAYPRLVEAIVV